MPVYEKSPGTFRVVTTVFGETLERVFRGTADEAKDYEAKWRLQRKAEGPRSERRAPPTFWEFLRGEYVAHARVALRPSWAKKQAYLLVPITSFFAGIKLDKISAPMVKAYAQRRLDAGLKRSSVNNEIRTLARVLSVARENEYVVPFTPKQITDDEERDVRAWSELDLARLLDEASVNAKRLFPLLVFAANTGVRKGEVVAARWEWVDLDRRMLFIQPSDAWRPKNGKPREVPISDALLPWLSGPRKSAFIFPKPGTLDRYGDFPQHPFEHVRDKVGLEGGPHTLRHTFASIFLSRGGKIYDLAQLLGHSHTRTTELYGHFMRDHMESARNIVNISPAIGPAAFEGSKKGIGVVK